MAQKNARRAETELRKYALSFPEAHEDFPWGERAAKVGKKVFAFFHVPGEGFHVTVKLPESATLALGLDFVEPTGYGLGKSGWVTASFAESDEPPVPVLKQWIEESYRAIAPKKLIAALDESERGQAGPASKSRPLPRRHRALRAK